MTEYLAPGVFIEKIERGPKPIEGVATSTAAFIGETERGPLRPHLITSYGEYLRLFGDLFGSDKYMPYAVKAFFDNGGRRCYITRVVGRNTGLASLPLAGFNISAIGPGPAYARVWVRILPGSSLDASNKPIGFRLQVYYWADATAAITDPAEHAGTTKPTWTAFEDFDDLSVDPASTAYFEKRVNHGNSSFVEITPTDLDAAVSLPTAEAGDRLASTVAAGDDLITSDYEGDEGADPNDRTGLAALDLDEFRSVAIVYCPNAEPEVAKAVINHCENNTFRFAVVDCPSGQADGSDLKPRDDLQDSQYAAYYYPWLWVSDPKSGGRKLVPPGGAVCGIYALTDDTRGVFKAPANEPVAGVIDLEFDVNQRTQEALDLKGVNVIRRFPGRGIRVWSARTMSSDQEWRYVNVRRLFVFLEASIYNSTQWVVFESNDDQLWARVKQTVTLFLRTQWREGALFGPAEDEAFSVAIGGETMTEEDILNGRLIVEIGVAPVRPAEFVIFRIFQQTQEAKA